MARPPSTGWKPDELTATRSRGAGRPRLTASLLLLVLAIFLVLAGLWASTATLDEVTRGEGQVIPSSQVKLIQNLEGGIVAQIRVAEGDRIAAGQTLLLIDDTDFASQLAELEVQRDQRQAAIARLEAELLGEAPVFADGLAARQPGLIDDALRLHAARAAEHESTLEILRRQRDQREQEMAEAETRLDQLERSYALAKEELDLTAPLVEQGVISKVELLRLQRTVNDLKGEMEQAELALPRLMHALNEAEKRIVEHETQRRVEALNELTEHKGVLKAVEEKIVAEADRIRRRAVISPVAGLVKKIHVTTLGGVIQPGETLAEIVPLEDMLLVEARIEPKDIAFIHPGQKAVVKLTAYDFSVYGGLEATLVHISPDSIADPQSPEPKPYYLIRVRTEKAALGSAEKPLPIIPGMTASVEILTGKKTVMDYLLKPILKARDSALRER